MKTYGGLGLMSCRGLAKANAKAVMAAVAYDLLKLVKALGDGPQASMARNELFRLLQIAVGALHKFRDPFRQLQVPVRAVVPFFLAELV